MTPESWLLELRRCKLPPSKTTSSPCSELLSVCDEHSDYKDAKLLYRFRKDDGTFPLTKDVKVFLRGQSLYEKYVSPSPATQL